MLRKLFRYKPRFIVLFFLLSLSIPIPAKTIKIGVIIDGHSKRQILPIDQIKHEIIKLNQGEFEIEFPDNKLINAHWSLESIRDGINKLNQDKTVDLILAQGLISSHLAAQFNGLKKPLIATVIADRVLQNLPYQDGISNKNNYTYVNTSNNVEQDIRQFYKLIPFKHLVIPADPILLKTFPFLPTMMAQVQKELGFKISFLPVVESLAKTLKQIPESADGIYLPPQMRFSKADLKIFAQGLIEKKIPSFSLLGRADLELGFMATLNGRKVDSLRFSRRIALMVQSILLGTNAAKLNVDLEQPPRLAINMATAKAIGFSPTWLQLEVAELLFNDRKTETNAITLTDAMKRAVSANLELLSNQMNVALASDQVDSSRSALLPQINIGVSGTHIDQNRAGAQQAQRSADAEINLSQLIYSERTWSGFDVAKLLKDAEDASFQTRILDILSQTATAYIRVLLAEATEQVRMANLKVSVSNLELAQQRVKIGYSTRSEEIRWKSVIATDRSALYLARADREQRETALKRLLHLPLYEPIPVTDKGISAQIDKLHHETFNHLFDNAIKFDRVINFEVERALKNAPELKQINHLSESARRQLEAGKRAYFVPDINVNARFGQNIEQGGVGAQNSNYKQDNWTVGFQATLPLYTSGTRAAEVSRSSNTLIQTRYQQKNIEQAIEARVQSAFQKTKGSFPSIRLSKDAAKAAKENFVLVNDSYANGVVSITPLIDAQNAVLSADLSAVEALYSFMIDWIEIQRSVANFDVLLSEQGIDQWYQELDVYFNQKSSQNH